MHFDRNRPTPYRRRQCATRSREQSRLLATTNKDLSKRGLVRLEGFEPPTNGFGSHYSIRLSYRRTGPAF